MKEHILSRLEPEIAESPAEILAGSDQHNSILFKRNRLYHHNLVRFNYTTYDVCRAQDVVNPRTAHCNIMLLKNCDDDGHSGKYCYAKVIGIHHANVVGPLVISLLICLTTLALLIVILSCVSIMDLGPVTYTLTRKGLTLCHR